MEFNKIVDIFFFKEKAENGRPVVTTGAIILGSLLRTFIILALSYFLVRKYMLYDYIIMLIFILWFLVAMPAYKAYQGFNTEMEKFKESTLCGTCKHFEKSAQLCKIYDEHPTKDYIPCDGLNWEPKSYEDE